MKKITWLLTAMMAVSIPFTAGAEEQTTAVESAEQSADTDFDSLSWDSYKLMIDDIVYQFPFMVSDLDAEKWTTSEDLTAELSPNSYGLFYYSEVKTGRQVMFQIANMANNTITAQEGIIFGIKIDNYDWDLNDANIRLPKGIVYGKSTREDIEAAYGTPSDVYEGDLYTKLTYSTDYYEEVELQIGTESGVLEGIDLECYRQPEGFDTGEVSTEVPAEVAAYTAPTEL
ncbi:MAG: hypothetical protein Q4B47_03510 [Eubacteriales bacterium]|nr:hypothetical protein [Eubacteriales bacterium]